MMTHIYKSLLLCVIALFTTSLHAENIVLYNDNGAGGIHKSSGKLVTFEGQYYVDLYKRLPNGRRDVKRLKVYRVKDEARLLYNQAKWAGKYAYVVEETFGFQTVPYYFNMKSRWRPSRTANPNDPYSVVPVKKLWVYRDDYNGGYTPVKTVLIKTQGKYMLYFGDDFFAAEIFSNARPLPNAPSWSRKYKYRSSISGFDVYFNM